MQSEVWSAGVAKMTQILTKIIHERGRWPYHQLESAKTFYESQECKRPEMFFTPVKVPLWLLLLNSPPLPQSKGSVVSCRWNKTQLIKFLIESRWSFRVFRLGDSTNKILEDQECLFEKDQQTRERTWRLTENNCLKLGGHWSGKGPHTGKSVCGLWEPEVVADANLRKKNETQNKTS